MNRKSIALILMVVVSLLIFISGCEGEDLSQEDKRVYEALDLPSTTFTEDSNKDLIKDFKNIVDSDNEPYTLIEFIDKNIEEVTEQEAVAMIVILEEVQEGYIQRYTDQLFKEDNQMELLKLSGTELFFDENKIENIKNASLERLVHKILKGKYKLINKEGAFYPTIDYEELKGYSEYLSDEMNNYIDIRLLDSNEPTILDASINISTDELAERLIKTENYILKYPESVRYEEMLRTYGVYLRLYLEGSANTPIYDYKTKEIADEVLSSYKKTKAIENTVTSKIVSKYIDMIEENQYTIEEDILSKVIQLHNEAIATLENGK